MLSPSSRREGWGQVICCLPAAQPACLRPACLPAVCLSDLLSVRLPCCLSTGGCSLPGGREGEKTGSLSPLFRRQEGGLQEVASKGLSGWAGALVIGRLVPARRGGKRHFRQLSIFRGGGEDLDFSFFFPGGSEVPHPLLLPPTPAPPPPPVFPPDWAPALLSALSLVLPPAPPTSSLPL